MPAFLGVGWSLGPVLTCGRTYSLHRTIRGEHLKTIKPSLATNRGQLSSQITLVGVCMRQRFRNEDC